MENVVLTIGGLLKSFGWSDLFFFVVTLLLIVMLVYIIYMVRIEDEEIIIKKPSPAAKPVQTKTPEKSLSKIVNELEMNYKPKPIDLSEYEKEQENTAIISYKELLEKASNNIYYDDEYDSGFDDVLIQKVDNKESKTQELVDLPKAIMMSYEAEEEFYQTLKVLQKNLVR